MLIKFEARFSAKRTALVLFASPIRRANLALDIGPAGGCRGRFDTDAMTRCRAKTDLASHAFNTFRDTASQANRRKNRPTRRHQGGDALSDRDLGALVPAMQVRR